MTKKLVILVALTVALSAAALMIGGPAPSADAAGSLAAAPACPNPGYYTGSSNSGNFQDALDGAIAAASACTGCCDFLVTWDFVSADGREGGFAGFNEANVTIKASW
jgi:hypothetical protein